MSYLLRFTGNYPPPLFALSFCHYCEHFYFYRFCSIGNERVVVEESSELRLSRGCVVINLLWFFTPLEPFHSYTNLMERAYISIFSIIVPWILEIWWNKKLFSLQLWFYASTYVCRSFPHVWLLLRNPHKHKERIQVVLVSSSTYLILRQIFVNVKAFFNYFYGFRPIFYPNGRAYRLITRII